MISMTRIASRFAVILSLLFGCSGRSGADAAGSSKRAPDPGMRVLFLGNSLTAANDLPLIVKALAKAGGQDLQVDSVTLGGANLEDLWNNGGALRAIDKGTAKGSWNVVVLQQGPSSLLESQIDLRKWTKRFAARIRKKGARPALYMVWPPNDRLAFFDQVSESYSLAAADVQGLLFPAGETWRAAWRRDPKAPLYSFDGFHPSAAGSYAAALSIYGVLFHKAPQGLPARLELGNGQTIDIPPALAKLLQEAATEANQKHGRP
jgi:lysophospholipase L1-like esterase